MGAIFTSVLNVFVIIVAIIISIIILGIIGMVVISVLSPKEEDNESQGFWEYVSSNIHNLFVLVFIVAVGLFLLYIIDSTCFYEITEDTKQHMQLIYQIHNNTWYFISQSILILSIISLSSFVGIIVFYKFSRLASYSIIVTIIFILFVLFL